MTYPKWDMEAVEAWKAECRRNATFDFCALHPVAQVHYEVLASMFSGSTVFAVGSWVQGGYLWPTDKTYLEKVQMKQKAYGRLNKVLSDFDCYADTFHIPKDLPRWADFPRVSIHEHKVKLPMWDFSRLPKEHHKAIIKAAEERDYLTIIRLHNEYQLSPYFYCCASDSLVRWVMWGVTQKHLTND